MLILTQHVIPYFTSCSWCHSIAYQPYHSNGTCARDTGSRDKANGCIYMIST